MSPKQERAFKKLIDSLTSENKELRRQVRQLRKLADRANVNYEDDELFDETEKEIERSNAEEPDKKRCKCGGEIKKVVVGKFIFNICQTCKAREKVLKSPAS